MKKTLIVIAVMAAVGLGYLAWHKPSQANQPAPAAARPAPEVAVVTMQEREVRLTSELPGRTAVYQVAEIRPQVGGIVLRRLFEQVHSVSLKTGVQTVVITHHSELLGAFDAVIEI